MFASTNVDSVDLSSFNIYKCCSSLSFRGQDISTEIFIVLQLQHVFAIEQAVLSFLLIGIFIKSNLWISSNTELGIFRDIVIDNLTKLGKINIKLNFFTYHSVFSESDGGNILKIKLRWLIEVIIIFSHVCNITIIKLPDTFKGCF